MNDTAVLYYEAHVTIEPVFDGKLELLKEIAKSYNFRVADLLMKKREEDSELRSKHDTFMTGHSKSYADIAIRLQQLIVKAKDNGFTVWRYKIEDTLLDSRVEDKLKLI